MVFCCKIRRRDGRKEGKQARSTLAIDDAVLLLLLWGIYSGWVGCGRLAATPPKQGKKQNVVGGGAVHTRAEQWKTRKDTKKEQRDGTILAPNSGLCWWLSLSFLSFMAMGCLVFSLLSFVVGFRLLFLRG